MTASRSFSDEQVALILRRAAELQQQERGRITLPELEAAAREAGIEPALVRRAAAEVIANGSIASSRVRHDRGRLAGAPLRIVEERRIQARFEAGLGSEIQAELQRQLGYVRSMHSQRALGWRTEMREGRDVRVSLAERGDAMLLRIEERHGGLAGGLFGGVCGGLGAAGLGIIVPLFVRASPWLFLPTLLVWFACAFVLARTIYVAIVRTRQRQLQELAATIEGMLESRMFADLQLGPGPPPISG